MHAFPRWGVSSLRARQACQEYPSLYAEKKELKDPDYLVPYPSKLKEAPTVKVDSTQAIPGGEPFLECYLILKRLKKSMYAWPFKTPVDPKALGIPEYLNVVQEPMDLKTM